MVYYRAPSGKTYTSPAPGRVAVSKPQRYVAPKKTSAITRPTDGGTVTVTAGGKVTERSPTGEVIERTTIPKTQAGRIVTEQAKAIERETATQIELKRQLTQQYESLIERQRAGGYAFAGYTPEQITKTKAEIQKAYRFAPSTAMAMKIVREQPEILGEYQREFREVTGMPLAPSYKFMAKVAKEYPEIEKIRFKEAHPLRAKYRELEEAFAKRTTIPAAEYLAGKGITRKAFMDIQEKQLKHNIKMMEKVGLGRFVSPERKAGELVKGVTYQYVGEFKEKPIKMGALTALGFVIPPAVAGVKYAIAGTRVAKGIGIAAKAYPTTAKVLGVTAKYGLPAAYVGIKGYEIHKAPTYFEKGRVIGRAGAEVTAILAGGLAGAKLARPITYQAQIKSAAARLPVGQRAMFKEYMKLAPKLKAPRVVEPSLKRVELLKGQPKGSGKTLLKHAQARGDILGGSVSQTAQVPKAMARKITPSDIDLYARVVNGKTAWAKVGRSYVQAYTKAGIKGSDWYYVSAKATRPEHILIRVGGKKIASVFPQKFLYQNIVEAGHPFPSMQITKTPKGLRILKLDVQAQRKVIAGFLQGRPGDIPAFRQIARGIKPKKWYDVVALDKKAELRFGRGFETTTEKPMWKVIQEGLKKTQVTRAKAFQKKLLLGKKAQLFLTPKGVPPSPIRKEYPVLYKPYGFPRAEPVISMMLAPPPYTTPKKPKEYKAPPSPLITKVKVVPYKVPPPLVPTKAVPYVVPTKPVPYRAPSAVPYVAPPAPYITPPTPAPTPMPLPFVPKEKAIVPPPIIEIPEEEKIRRVPRKIPKLFPRLKKAYAFTLWRPTIKVKAGKLPSVVRTLGATVFTGLRPRPRVVIGFPKAKKKKKKRKR